MKWLRSEKNETDCEMEYNRKTGTSNFGVCSSQMNIVQLRSALSYFLANSQRTHNASVCMSWYYFVLMLCTDLLTCIAHTAHKTSARNEQLARLNSRFIGLNEKSEFRVVERNARV